MFGVYHRRAGGLTVDEAPNTPRFSGVFFRLGALGTSERDLFFALEPFVWDGIAVFPRGPLLEIKGTRFFGVKPHEPARTHRENA